MEKKHIVSLVDGLKSGLEVAGLNNRAEIASVVISAESMDQNQAVAARESLSSLKSLVVDTLSTVTSMEGMEDYDLTAAQISAATLVAGMATDPSATRANLGSLKAVSASNVVGTLDGHDLGIEDMVNPDNIAMESFDGQTINSAVYFSVVYNLLASRQDAFGETFFPTITIDPTTSGASIEARVINLYSEMTRNTSGKGDRGKFNKKSIVKAITDPSILSVDKNLCVPVLRDESKGVLAEDLASVNKEKGETITTAPIKIGQVVSILGVSQTDSQLAKGVMDNTDALDRRVQVQDLFIDITGRNAADDADLTETFKVNIAAMPHSNFTYSTQDHQKDLSMSFNTDNIIFSTSATKKWDGVGSEVLANLAENYNVRLKLVLHGDGNTEFGEVAVYQSELSIAEIIDAGGNIVEAGDATYDAIAAVLGTANVRAYSVEAYTTNSNIRQRGQLVGVDIHNQIYTVPVRSGITILKTVTNSNDTDNDATYLASQVTFTGIKMSLEAVNTLVNFSETLRNITLNGSQKDVSVLGVSRFFVDAYYNEISINVANTIDSKRSGERAEDIKAALVARIKDEVAQMHVESNYGVAKNVLDGANSGKVKVAIGTDSRIAQYLTTGNAKIDLGVDFDVVVVTTANPRIKGKMYVTFVDGMTTKNEKVNPLGFGCTFWSPELSVDVVSNRGGAIARELSTMPRFLHVAQLPIMAVFNVSGLEDSLSKITANRRTV